MANKFPTEKEYLIGIALAKYNRQFRKNIKIADCDIMSITTRVNFDRSYEIKTKREDDYVTLHMHLSFGSTDMLRDYRLEVFGVHRKSSLGDEVNVTTGTIDRYNLDSGVYKFRWIGPKVEQGSFLYQADGTSLLTQADGSPFLVLG